MALPMHIIVLDRATDEQLNEAHQIIKSESKGWWHHYTNVWLVRDRTASDWRDSLKRVVVGGPASVSVFRLPDAGHRKWASYGFKAKARSEWLHKHYTKD